MVVEHGSRTDELVDLDDPPMMGEFDESRVELVDEIAIATADADTDVVDGLEPCDFIEDSGLALEQVGLEDLELVVLGI